MLYENLLDLLIIFLALVTLSWAALGAGAKAGLLLKHMYLKDRLTLMCMDMADALHVCKDPSRVRVLQDRAAAVNLLIQSSHRVALAAGYQAFQRGAIALASGFLIWIVF